MHASKRFLAAALSLLLYACALPPQPAATTQISVVSCAQLQAACRAQCAGAATCNADCDRVCAAAADATHCKYDSASHSCDAAACTGASCTWVGSTQPTYSDCLAHCASTQSARPDRPLGLVLVLCGRPGTPPCRGGSLEDQKQCSYNTGTGECHAVSCPAGGSCGSVGSTQPNQAACYAHCAAN